jgi:hypothetical protein
MSKEIAGVRVRKTKIYRQAELLLEAVAPRRLCYIVVARTFLGECSPPSVPCLVPET